MGQAPYAARKALASALGAGADREAAACGSSRKCGVKTLRAKHAFAGGQRSHLAPLLTFKGGAWHLYV